MNQASLYLYTIYGKNAHRRDLPFELSEQRFLDLTKSNCYYCGSTPATVVKRGKDIYVYNGIDRKNNTIGYTINNSVSCCGRCNKMKFDLNQPNNYVSYLIIAVIITIILVISILVIKRKSKY